MKYERDHTAMRSTKISICSKTKSFSTLDAVPVFSACMATNFLRKIHLLTLLRFAARAGAKHVIGVDMSSIINKAKQIVAVNGLSSKITLLQGKMEEVEMPLQHMVDGKVDIIVSEWMGYFLLYESMLDTVLYARDKYMRPGGKIFPDKATIYMAGIEDGEYKDDKIGCKQTSCN